MSRRPYDPAQYTVVIMGVKPVGFVQGSFITVKRKTPLNSTSVGALGEVTVTRSNDRRAEIEIKLEQTSPTNDDFSALAALDRNTPNGISGTFLLKDRNGRQELSGAECIMIQEADTDLDVTPKERVWKFEVCRLEGVDGGAGT